MAATMRLTTTPLFPKWFLTITTTVLLTIYLTHRHNYLNNQPRNAPSPPLRRHLQTTASTNWPEVVWLMTYPNSGTGFTLNLIQIATNTATGTNYGLELRNSKIDYINNHQFSHSDNGPYRGSRRPLPPRYILTKTHCLGFCDECSPRQYVSGDVDNFFKSCALGSKHKVLPDGSQEDVRVYYDPNIVSKAVHLIRSPFDNIASRFHYSYTVSQKRGTEFAHEWTPEGFRNYCRELDQRWMNEEEKYFAADVFEVSRKVPCRSMFYQYVQWHNNAFAVIKEKGIESMVVYYEDYMTNMRLPLMTMLEFLELEHAGIVRKFEWNGGHEHFYTEEERNAVNKMIHLLASDTTYEHLKKYLDTDSYDFSVRL